MEQTTRAIGSWRCGLASRLADEASGKQSQYRRGPSRTARNRLRHLDQVADRCYLEKRSLLLRLIPPEKLHKIAIWAGSGPRSRCCGRATEVAQGLARAEPALHERDITLPAALAPEELARAQTTGHATSPQGGAAPGASGRGWQPQDSL